MICEHCGTEHAEEGYDESETIEAVWSCRNALKAQLDSMTKRAEEAERNAQSLEDSNAEDFRILREAMTAVGIEYAGPQDAYSIARHFTLALFAAEAELATMTKRAEDAEREKTELLDTILTPEDYAKSSQDLWAQAVQADKERDAAEAKLATAVEALRWYVRGKVDGGVCAYDTLRTLGIDPSKEQEK